MAALRNARHTRQQTLTQIDFVSRTPRFEEEEEDDWELERELQAPPPKRRRKSPTRRRAGEDVGQSDLIPVDRGDAPQMAEAPPSEASAPDLHGHRFNSRRGPSTPRTVRILEIPSSRRSPSQSPLFVKQEDKALVEKSVNVQILPGIVGRKRKEVRGKPKLEVRDTYAEGDEMSQVPQEFLFLERQISTPNHQDQKSVLKAVDRDEPARTIQWKDEGDSSIEEEPNIGSRRSLSGIRDHAPLKTSAKLEIQDSETEAASDDDDDDLEAELKGLEASNNPTSSDSLQQTLNGSDDEYLPSLEMSGGEEGEESQYPIGLETQAIVDSIDLSSSSDSLYLQSDATEGISLEPTTITSTPVQSASTEASNEAHSTPASSHEANPNQPLPIQKPQSTLSSPTIEQEPNQLPTPAQHDMPLLHPTPSSSETTHHPPAATATMNSPSRPFKAVPTSAHYSINDNDNEDADDDHAEPDIEGVEEEEQDNNLEDIDLDLDLDNASETMSQLLPESLMESFVPPPPPPLLLSMSMMLSPSQESISAVLRMEQED